MLTAVADAIEATGLLAAQVVPVEPATPMAAPGYGLVSLAVIFFVIAIIAYVLGARGVAGMSAGIGRTLLFVFLVLAVVVFIFSFVRMA